jgi:hypothetical protein
MICKSDGAILGGMWDSRSHLEIGHGLRGIHSDIGVYQD